MERIDVAALIVFLTGVVFYSGITAARISALESWRRDMKHELDAIHDGLRKIERVIDRAFPSTEQR